MARRQAAADAMPLIDHFRELRRRLIVSAVAVLVAVVPAWLWFPAIFAFVRAPFDQTVSELGNQVQMVLPGVMDPFSLQVQITLVSAAVMASPVWLYQTWRFITPGLHRHERRWAYAFVGTAVPLIGAGAALAYQMLPFGLQILLGFTPGNVQNLISVDKYIDFVGKMLLAFCGGFLTPLLVVMLNLAGVLSAAQIRTWWRGTLMGVLFFAAIATPTGDPFNMMLLAAPICLLLVLAYVVAAVNDSLKRRRVRSAPL